MKIEQDPNSNPTPEAIAERERASLASGYRDELKAARRRLAELQAMDAHPNELAAAKERQRNAERLVREHGDDQEAGDKRPRTPRDRQTRKKGES